MTEPEQMEAAYRAFATRLLHNPDDHEALQAQSVILTACGGSVHMPWMLAERCSAILPDPESLLSLGSALLRLGRFKEAIQVLHRAEEGVPEHFRATLYSHLGLAHYYLGRPTWAETWYRKAHDADPTRLEITAGIGMSLMAQGKLAEGMFKYECEAWIKGNPRPVIQSGIPRWKGEPLDGKHLIVTHDQGFGDTIQFIRYANEVKAGKVSLSMPPVLTRLIESMTDHPVISEAGPFDADYYATPMSLMGAMGIEYKDVSGKPYIAAEPIKLPARGKLKVGLAWSKGRIHVDRATHLDVFHAHSLTLDDVCPLFAIPGTAWHSLQVGESEQIAAAGLHGFLADLTVGIKDWLDTARCIAAMDVVVTACTGTAHLAGAMGKPTLILTPTPRCWRWMRGRKDTPWYDSVTLATQENPGDWSGPIETAKAWLLKRTPSNIMEQSGLASVAASRGSQCGPSRNT